MVNFNRTFGVHSNLKRGILLYHNISAFDAFAVVISGMAILGANSKFFVNQGSCHWPQILFNICAISLVIYSLLHPRSNPHKRNCDLLLLSFLPTVRYFQSIPNYQHYHRMQNPWLDKIPYSMNHRLPLNKALLYRMPGSSKKPSDK